MVSPLRAWAPVAVCVAAGLLLAGPVAAQAPDPPPPRPAGALPPAPPPRAPRAALPFALGETPRPPAQRSRKRAAFTPRNKRGPEVMPPEGTPIASSPSFARLDDGKTRVWIEVSRKVDVAENRAQGRVVYRLRGASVAQQNSQLPLPTGYFTTPVERVQLVRQGPDLDLIIELRELADPVYSVVETPRGMVLQVDFPRSQSPAHDDGAPDVARPSAPRSSRTRSLGAARPPDDAPRSMDDN